MALTDSAGAVAVGVAPSADRAARAEPSAAVTVALGAVLNAVLAGDAPSELALVIHAVRVVDAELPVGAA